MFSAQRRHGLVAVLTLLTILVLAACGQTNSAQPPSGATAGATQTSVPQADGDAKRGEVLFAESGCVACHKTTTEKLVGPGLAGVFEGKGAYGKNLPNGKPIDEKNLKEWIKIGGIGQIGQMPSNPTLTDAQLNDLVAYIKTLK